MGANGDGTGGLLSGAVYVFEKRENAPWLQTHKIRPMSSAANDEFGYSVSTSGDTIIVGAPALAPAPNERPGSAYIYEKQQDGEWAASRLSPMDPQINDAFGLAVSISGDTAVVGAFNHKIADQVVGAAYVFKRQDDGAWTQQAKLIAQNGRNGDRFGTRLALQEKR